MLFYLDDSLIVDVGNHEYIPILKSVHNLALQAVEANHLLLGDVKVILHFRDIFKNDVFVGPLFQKLASNMAICTVPSSVTFYMEIIRGACNQRENGGVTIYQMNYTHFSSLDASGKTMVIGEDLNDVVIFEHILKWFINRTHSNLHYCLHPLGGNGRNICRVVQNELNSSHITICIVDTDKKHPNYTPAADSTYSLCLPIGNGVPDYKFVHLNVHEIENIIPLKYIDTFDIWTNGNSMDQHNKRAFDFLKTMANDILPYFDYKKGIHKNTDLTTNQDYFDFAEKCFIANQDKTTAYADFTTYLSSIGDNGIVYEQLLGGSGILTRTVALISSSACPTTPVLESFQEIEWNTIGQNMLNWCIARNNEGLN